MKYFISIIIFFAVFSCTKHQEVEKKQSKDAFLNIFNIYETPDFLNKELKASKNKQKPRPYIRIRIDKELLRQCFIEAINDKRAGTLCENTLNIVFINLLVSEKGKVMGMRIKTAKESDITDNEIKTLSRYLSKIKISNTNGYPVPVNEQFSFSNDYFLAPKH